MRTSHLNVVVIVLFALSGATGLVYEVAWSKYLSLFIGNTTYSHMIVLATFMGGLALGAWYWGKHADRSRNTLRLYGILELLIGGYCLVYPAIIHFSEVIFIGSASSLGISAGSAALLFLKFLLSFSTLIVPTFLMGGTLPILTKFFVHDIAQTGTSVATLYFTNSLGAVVGSASAGFFLIRTYSLDTTVWISAALNILIGGTIFFIAANIGKKSAPLISPSATAEKSARHFSRRTVIVAITAAALSGCTAMIYELTWIRLLSNIFGSSTYSFSLMLTAFISGIALGSLVSAFLLRRFRNVVGLLGLCQLGTAFAMIAALPLYERLPYYMVRIAGLIANKPEHFPLFLSLEFIFCFAIMIVPTTFSGMSLPIASHIAGSEMKILGKSVGGIFSVNTLGTVCGALATGLVLIPFLGIKQSLEAGVLVNGVAGIVIIASESSIRRRLITAVAILFVGTAAAYRIAYPSWNVLSSTSGVFRAFGHEVPGSFEEFLKPFNARNVLWYKEGVNANVAVVELPGDRDSVQRALLINGKADASTDGDLATQILLAQIPLLLMPDSGDALIIGLGSGITAASALTHPLRSVDCVEISSEVVECNPYFADANRNVMNDPRLRLHQEDGITFLKLATNRFDFIINEPSNPWISGIGNLFSREFFQLCSDHLTSRGVLTQWFHMYELSDEVFKLVLHTLSSVFPHVMIWMPNESDVILLASRFPIRPDFDLLQRRMSLPPIAEDLARIEILDVPTLLSAQSTAQLSASLFSSEDMINTEKRPLLEFLAPVSLYASAALTFPDSIDERFAPGVSDLWIAKLQQQHALTAKDYLAVGQFQMRTPTNYRMAFSALTKCLRLDPINVEAIGALVRVTDALQMKDARLTALKTLAALFPNDVTVLSQLADEMYRQEVATASVVNPPAMVEPVRLLERCTELSNKEDERFLLALALILNRAGRYDEAANAYRQVRDVRARIEASAEISDDDVLLFMAENWYFAGNYREASAALEKLQPPASGNAKARRLRENIMNRMKGTH